MMNTITNHKSIRKFKSVPIDKLVLNQLVEAASRASTTGNMQVYSIILTSREDIKQQLWEAHFKQNMVLQAPVVATFCADFNRFNKWCRQREANPGYDNFLSFYTASIDALLAAQNFALAAESKGLGICYLGTTVYMAEKIIEILELPTAVVPVTTIVLGYADESPTLTDRLPDKAIVHEEKYKDYSSQVIDELYAEKEALPLSQELLTINNKKTLAQIFTDNRYTRADNIKFSRMFLDVLEKQGFMNND